MPASASNSRKRKETEPVASTSKAPQPLDLVQGTLDLGSDADLDEDDDLADDASVGEEGDPFPELDVGSSDEEDDERDAGELADVEEDAVDGGADSSDDEGYNSSDIEALENDEGFTPPSSYAGSSSRRSSRSKSPVSSFIAAHTSKPDERDPSIILRPEDPLQGKMVVSALTGRPKRVYPDIEAGYGSESSTEDVSGLFDTLCIACSRLIQLLCRRRTVWVTSPITGTTTSRTSATTWTARKSCDQLRETSSTDSSRPSRIPTAGQSARCICSPAKLADP